MSTWEFPDTSSASVVKGALEKFVAQSVDADAAMAIIAGITPQGRFTQRAPRKAKSPVAPKAVSTTPTEAITSEDEVFVRPNGDKYFARKWGAHQDVAALRTAREATTAAFSGAHGSPMFALFYGAPGCGKTALVEAAFGTEMYTLLGTGDTEVSDLIGGYVQTPSGGFEWIDGDLIRAMEEGKAYFIDEIGLVDPKVLSVLYAAMDGRREVTVTANPERGTVKADPNFYVVAATNPNAPGVRLSEALLSRFTVQVEMATDWSLAKKLGVPSDITTVAQNLAKKCESGEVSWAPQMRELLAYRDVAATFGAEFAISNLMAAAPEIDRPVVADVLSRVFGTVYKPARI